MSVPQDHGHLPQARSVSAHVRIRAMSRGRRETEAVTNGDQNAWVRKDSRQRTRATSTGVARSLGFGHTPWDGKANMSSPERLVMDALKEACDRPPTSAARRCPLPGRIRENWVPED